MIGFLLSRHLVLEKNEGCTVYDHKAVKTGILLSKKRVVAVISAFSDRHHFSDFAGVSCGLSFAGSIIGRGFHLMSAQPPYAKT
jgi:hypothetical protein